MSAPSDPRADAWDQLKGWQKFLAVIAVVILALAFAYLVGAPAFPADA
jgi:anti-sigma-K factor RskA